ncbi:MAG: 50S ribosomal protein L1, partial [Desulfopila sp.]
IIHAGVGKASFGKDKIYENIAAFIAKLIQLKPSASKGIYLRGISVSTTMSPGFKVDPIDVRAVVK